MTTGRQLPSEPGKRTPSAWSSGLILAVVAAICTALVAITWHLTAPRIAENEKAALEQSLAPTLSDVFYDNDLSESTLVVPPPHELPGKEAATIYRVYSESKPVAAVFVVTARDGFAGPIKLLIGIDYSGEVKGVRVLAHQETPGLGDLIEASKSDWIQQFAATSLASPVRERWSIRRDGGEFDHLTGASITSRAVVKAVKETLLYFENHRDSIFEAQGLEQEAADR
jgi:Na+-translocating ferredoxin:NAD+ oxidoreductase subunit G